MAYFKNIIANMNMNSKSVTNQSLFSKLNMSNKKNTSTRENVLEQISRLSMACFSLSVRTKGVLILTDVFA